MPTRQCTSKGKSGYKYGTKKKPQKQVVAIAMSKAGKKRKRGR